MRRADNIESTTASDALYVAIRGRILSGQLPPGAALSENELAGEFGVSRTPAREALRRLSLAKLVDIIPKRGTFVAPLPSPGAIRQLYEFREAVAGMTARLAAANATSEDHQRLRGLIEEMEQVASPEEKGDVADRFIAAIDNCSRNELLRDASRDVLDQIHRFRQSVMDRDVTYFDAALEKRRHLVHAIECADADEAERLARDIVRYVRHEVMHLVMGS